MPRINLTELIADREAGTEGPWVPTEYGYEKISINGERGIEIASCWRRADARRIARLPDLEASYIEAVRVIRQYASGATDTGLLACKFLGDGE